MPSDNQMQDLRQEHSSLGLLLTHQVLLLVLQFGPSHVLACMSSLDFVRKTSPPLQFNRIFL